MYKDNITNTVYVNKKCYIEINDTKNFTTFTIDTSIDGRIHLSEDKHLLS